MSYLSNKDSDLVEFILDNSELLVAQRVDHNIKDEDLKFSSEKVDKLKAEGSLRRMFIKLTPMDIAAEYGYYELVKKFIKRYDDPATQMQNKGNHGHPIGGAFMMGHHDIVKFLIQYADEDTKKKFEKIY